MAEGMAVFLLFVVAAVAVSALPYVPAEEPVPNQYLVVLRPSSVASSLLGPDVNLRRSWSYGDFHALLVETASLEALERLRRSPDVVSVEQNGVVRASQQCNTQHDATWGINRVNQRTPNLDGNFVYQQTGQGVTVYVVDTGIRLDHVEFRGRAIWGTNTIDSNNTDGNGHGTHAAGTIGGLVYGVAKGCTLVAVKVLNANGSGTYASIIDGLSWVVAYNSANKRKGIINMSLGGSKNAALNNATDAASRAGILVIAAAGGENTDACTRSPGSAPTALTVAATTLDPASGGQQDARASSSNYGPCVKAFAPGTVITSAWSTSPTAIQIISGTSTAAPHVAGVAAVLWSKDVSKTASQVQSEMAALSLNGIINLKCDNASCRSTPNKLIHFPRC